MSIKVISTGDNFTDVFGNSTPQQYKANAGDIITHTFTVEESIYFESSDLKKMYVNAQFLTNKTITFPDYESINGFALGQSVTLNYQSGIVTESATTSIVSIDYNTLKVVLDDTGTLVVPPGLDFDSTDQLEIYSNDVRIGLYMHINLTDPQLPAKIGTVASTTYGGFVAPTQPFRASVIDGTVNRFYTDTSLLAVGDSATFVQEGHKSGHILSEISITRASDLNAYTRVWEITIKNIQIGAIADVLFNTNQPPSYYFDFEWYSTTDFSVPTVVQYNLKPSNTGFFDESYNNGTVNSTLIQSVTNPIYYNANTTHTIKIDSAISEITIGAIFKSANDSYFKVKYNTQKELGMLLSFDSVDLPLATGVFTSETNPNGVNYQIEITAISYTAGQHEITFDFKINDDFKSFMEANGIGDRLMRIWFKVGNVNHLVFNGQLEKKDKELKVWDDLDPSTLTDFAIFRTDKLTDTYPATGATGNGGGFASIEDNLIMEVYALMPKTDFWEKSKFEVIILNTADPTEYYVLETYNFDWAQPQRDTTGMVSPITGQGTVLIDSAIAITENLPSTADYRTRASVKYTGEFDTTPKFTVRFACPLIINWRYWISQPNAPVVFFPNQNKNYLNYFDAPYTIAVRTTVENQDTIYYHDAPIDALYDYDETFTSIPEEWNGTVSFKYFRNETEEIGQLLADELIRVLVTFDTVQTVTAPQSWGQLTIEPLEGAPRWLLSSNYSTDGNANNPITPLVGQTLLKKTIVSSTQVTFEAYIDGSKLDVGNYKLTCKLYNDNPTKVEQVRAKDETVLTKSLQGFEMDENDDCCENTFNVFAEEIYSEARKNDITAIYKIVPKSGSVEFQLFKDDIFKEVIPSNTVPNQSNAKYAMLNWIDVLSSYGEGCYQIKIEVTNVASVVTLETWGQYELLIWSTENVEGFVQLKGLFNQNQSVDGIDFTNALMVDCLNVKGFFGNRDPRTEIDNIVYNTRLDISVVRENLNQYEFKTDPVSRIFTRKLLDFFLLSEVDLQVTDNNSFNHEKYILKRVIVEEVPTPTYYDYSKKAVVTAKMGDKVKNQKTFY